MRRILISGLLVGLLALLAATAVLAQEATVDEVEAKFGGLTRTEIEAMGYVVESVCVDASQLPTELREQFGFPGSAAMGFHAVREDLVDDQLNALEPEAIMLGPNDEVWGVEYEAVAETADPMLFGQAFTFLEGGHPGMEYDHYILHLWFVDNPAGQFADFNPALTCPAPAVLPATGGAQPLIPFGSWLLAGLGLLVIGGGLWLWREKTAPR